MSSAGFVRGVGRSASWIFLPLILLTHYSLSFFQIGVLIAAVIPVSVGSNFLSGYIGDRHGRRAIAVIPSFFMSATMASLYHYIDSGVAVVMLLWAAGEFFTDLAMPAQNAMMGDISRGNDAVRAFSTKRIFSNAGFAISPALGGFLAQGNGLPVVFLVASVTTLTEGVILALFLKESFAGSRRERSALRDISFPFRDMRFLQLLIVLVGLTVLADQYGSTLTLFLGGVNSVPYFEMGLIYSVNGILVVTLQPLMTKLMGRRGLLVHWLASGSVIYGVAYLTLLAGSLPVYFVSMTLLTLGEDIVSPTQQALVSESARPDRRAAYFGSYSATENGSKAIAPLMGTFILGLGASGPLILWLGMFLLGLMVSAGFLRLKRGLPQEAFSTTS